MNPKTILKITNFIQFENSFDLKSSRFISMLSLEGNIFLSSSISVTFKLYHFLHDITSSLKNRNSYNHCVDKNGEYFCKEHDWFMIFSNFHKTLLLNFTLFSFKLKTIFELLVILIMLYSASMEYYVLYNQRTSNKCLEKCALE